MIYHVLLFNTIKTTEPTSRVGEPQPEEDRKACIKKENGEWVEVVNNFCYLEDTIKAGGVQKLH